MRTLLLLRHGNAESNVPGQADHDRPLDSRGIAEARLMGRFMAATVGAPDRILTSSALRAQTTAQLATDAGGWNRPAQRCPSLYESSVDTVLDEAAQAGDEVACQLLVGHQPVWSATVTRLIGGGQVHMPTAGLACVRLPLNRWSDLSRTRGALSWLVTPEQVDPLESALPGSR